MLLTKICWVSITTIMFAIINALKQISPRDLMALVLIFTTGANMIKGACQKRNSPFLRPVCSATSPILDFWLEASDLKYVIGAVLLTYALSLVYDKIRPAIRVF